MSAAVVVVVANARIGVDNRRAADVGASIRVVVRNNRGTLIISELGRSFLAVCCLTEV